MKRKTVIHQITLYYDVNANTCMEEYGCELDDLDSRRVMEKDNKLNVRKLVQRCDDGTITGWSVTDIKGS